MWFPIFLSLLVFTMFMAVGYAGTADGVKLTGRSENSFPAVFLHILSGNIRSLLVLVVSSVLSIGICGLVFFALNGYAAGSILGVLSGDSIVYFLLFLPLEIVAFALAFAYACRASLMLIDNLRDVEHSRPTIRVVVCSVLRVLSLLVLAALAESLSIKLAWG